MDKNKITKYILYILISCIIIMLYVTIYCVQNGIYLFQAVGSSMYPTLKDGEFIICQTKSDYEVNDIVIYDNRFVNNEDYDLTIHRIIYKDNLGFIIKGDNNPREDIGLHKIDSILCKMIFPKEDMGIWI